MSIYIVQLAVYQVISCMSTLQGFRVARKELFSESRPNVTKLAILVTDGKANRETTATFTEANLTKADNVEVFTIGIGQVSNFGTLTLLWSVECTEAKLVF